MPAEKDILRLQVTVDDGGLRPQKNSQRHSRRGSEPRPRAGSAMPVRDPRTHELTITVTITIPITIAITCMSEP